MNEHVKLMSYRIKFTSIICKLVCRTYGMHAI
uniref:Uncharacterized protein n=1 Tax=Arundo donax TaxID=35708 RepID=A0A0A9HTY3_ARUDO